MDEALECEPPLVDIQRLNVEFSGHGAVVHAVRDVTLRVGTGEVLALIGESGSGKSATLRTLMRLHPARRTRITGSIKIAGQDVLSLSSGMLRALRGKVVGMVFQEPLLAFDPVYRVGDQIIEAIRSHERIAHAAARARALSLFQQVQIPGAEKRLMAYPHEMSGGMRQRAMIALALACRPKLLLADEPTTALDATVQIQILLLLRQLQKDLGLSVVFVTHDMGAAAEVADRVAVMYAGQIVEEGSALDVFHTPKHPYTQALLSSQRQGRMSAGQRLPVLSGAPPDLSQTQTGCAFAARCAYRIEACTSSAPVPLAQLTPMHAARCIRAGAAVDTSGARQTSESPAP